MKHHREVQHFEIYVMFDSKYSSEGESTMNKALLSNEDK